MIARSLPEKPGLHSRPPPLGGFLPSQVGLGDLISVRQALEKMRYSQEPQAWGKPRAARGCPSLPSGPAHVPGSHGPRATAEVGPKALSSSREPLCPGEVGVDRKWTPAPPGPQDRWHTLGSRGAEPKTGAFMTLETDAVQSRCLRVGELKSFVWVLQ